MRVAVLHYDEHALFTPVLQQAEKTTPDISFFFINTPSVSALRFRWWCTAVLPKLLEQNNIALLINYTNAYIGKIKIPQLLLTDDLTFLLNPELVHKSVRKKRVTVFTKNMQSVQHIMVPLSIAQKCIAEQYPTNQKPVSVIAPATVWLDEWGFDQREKVKQQVADGSEYFFFVEGNEQQNHLFNVLKAFSKFKKWQLSSMKLVIAHKLTDEDNNKLRLFKYKDDVIVTDNHMSADLLRAAYALIYTNTMESFAVPVLQAMYTGVPVIATQSNCTEEIAANAALYAVNNSVDELSAHLIQVYKDEAYRSKMIAIGKERAVNYSVTKSAQSLTQLLNQLVQS